MNPTPAYSTKLFREVWDGFESFKADFDLCPAKDCLSQDIQLKVFWLLAARYRNDPIANLDVDQWKDRVFSIIFQYGPAWERRLDIQKRLRSLNEEDIIIGTKSIHNAALNPGGEPSTCALDEIPTVNSQNTSAIKKSKMDAYAQLWSILSLDVTEEFLVKFKKLFKPFVSPERPVLYWEEM